MVRPLVEAALASGRDAKDVARPLFRRTGRRQRDMAGRRTGDPAAIDNEIGLRGIRLRLVLRVASKPSGRPDRRKKRVGGKIAREDAIGRKIALIIAVVVIEEIGGDAVAHGAVAVAKDLRGGRLVRQQSRKHPKQDSLFQIHYPHEPITNGLAVPQSPRHPVSLPRRNCR